MDKTSMSFVREALALKADPLTTTIGEGQRNVAGMLLGFSLLTFAQAGLLVWRFNTSLRPVYALLAALSFLGVAVILLSATYFAVADMTLSSADISQTTLGNMRYVFQASFGVARVFCLWVAFDALGLLRQVDRARDGQNAHPFGFEWSPAAIAKGKLAFVYGAIVALITAALGIAAEYLFDNDPQSANISSGCAQCGGFVSPSSWYTTLAKGLFDTCIYGFQDPVETLATILNIPIYVALLVAGGLIFRHEFKQNGALFPRATMTHQIILVVLFTAIQLLPWDFAAGVGVDRTQEPFTACGGFIDDSTASKYVSWMASSSAMRVLPMILLTSAAWLARMVNHAGHFSIMPEVANRDYHAQPEVTSKLLE